MRVCGKMTFSTAMVLRPGLTSLATKATTLSGASTASVAINGTMVRCIQAIGERIKFRGSVFILGWTAASTKESGLTTIWKVWAFTYGTTEGCTADSTRTIKNMASEFILGPTSAATKVFGTRASSTV